MGNNIYCSWCCDPDNETNEPRSNRPKPITVGAFECRDPVSQNLNQHVRMIS